MKNMELNSGHLMVALGTLIFVASWFLLGIIPGLVATLATTGIILIVVGTNAISAAVQQAALDAIEYESLINGSENVERFGSGNSDLKS